MNKSILHMNYIDNNINNSGIYFYNRTDFRDIISQLSPLRKTIIKTIPKLYYLGILTNILCTIVLLQKQLINRKSIFYLIFLSLSDLMYNIVSLIPEFLIDINLVDYDIFKRSNVGCFFYDFRVTLFHFYSVLMTLFVTIERFYHIFHPLKLNNLFEDKKYLSVAAMLIVSFILALPHGVLMIYNKDENDCDAHPFFKTKVFNTGLTYYQIYFTFTEPVLVWFIPGIIILILNSCVIYKIIRSNKTSIRVLSFSKRKYPKMSNSNVHLNRSRCTNDLNEETTRDNIEFSVKNDTVNFDLPNRQDELLLQKPSTKQSDHTNNTNKKNINKKIKANQISHYITIIVLGFYFIATTIPYVILLSLQNNLTLKLNYFLSAKEDYLRDSLWRRYGTFRDINSFGKLFFVSNHCINFFFYFIFNQYFRANFFQLFSKTKRKIKSLF